MSEKLYIRRFGDPNVHNMILMNPTPMQLCQRVCEVQDPINDLHMQQIYVNPAVIKNIYFKLFQDYDMPRYFGRPDKDTMVWSFSYRTGEECGERSHDNNGRAISGINFEFYIKDENPNETSRVYLLEYYGGKGNTFYRIKYPFDDIGFTYFKIGDEPILSQISHRKSIQNDKYRFFICGALIFLQLYGWKTIPMFPKHELGVI